MGTVILISGKAFAGKDEVANIFTNVGYFWSSFAKELKLIYGRLFGVDGQRMIDDPAYKVQQREGLIWFGKMCRTHNQDVWANLFYQEFEASKIFSGVCSDNRFPNEHRVGVNRGHRVYSLRVKASADIRQERMGQAAWERYQATFQNDPSEVALDRWQPDFEVSNNGTIRELTSAVLWVRDAIESSEGTGLAPLDHSPEEYGNLTGVLEPSWDYLKKKILRVEGALRDMGVDPQGI